MKTEDGRTIEDHGKGDDARLGIEEALVTADTDASAENSAGHDVPMLSGPDLIMDARLTSAAAPFLYMLSLVLIAVAGYFVYLFFYG